MIPRAKKTGRWTRGGVANLLCRVRVSSWWEVADDVLDHHHGAIDQHAEVQRAQGEQVGGNWLMSRQMEANISAKEW